MRKRFWLALSRFSGNSKSKLKATGDKILWLQESKEKLKQATAQQNIRAVHHFASTYGEKWDKQIQQNMDAMADMEQRCADLVAQSKQQYIKMLLAQEKALRKQGIAD